ncbi:MAG: heme-binding protein [Kofleriaceae bacterium]|nr:heme-binding protein [Kofleriaceae bacterium]
MDIESHFEDELLYPQRPASTGIATKPHGRRLLRNVELGVAMVALPLAAFAGVSRLADSRRAGLIAGGLALLGLAGMRWQLQRLFTDEPAYRRERKLRDIEIRTYEPRVEATVRIPTSDFDEARERGFRRLASYLFGANATREKLAMTAPVLMRAYAGGYEMSFVMPAERSINSLPLPDDPSVHLLELPATRVAVHTYRGNYNASSVAEHARELLRRVSRAGLRAAGRPTFAGFDPPSTAPSLRRTELWVELE